MGVMFLKPCTSNHNFSHVWEHLRSICRRSIDSIFYNVYIDGRYDGVFEKLNPKELKCVFRKWPLINSDVVGYKNVPCMYRLDKRIDIHRWKV